MRVAIVVALLGIAARLYAGSLGCNHDGYMWAQVGQEYWLQGERVIYDGSLYGPVWFHLCALMALLPWPVQTSCTLLLTASDCGLAWLLWRWYGLGVATLFFLNPISILITGYHRQFDTLAILVGMIAVNLIVKGENYANKSFS